jgi:hypothetical protein
VSQLASNGLTSLRSDEIAALLGERKRSTGRTVLIGVAAVLGVLALAVGVVAAVSGKAIMSQYPAALKVAGELPGLTRVDDPDLNKALRELASKADGRFGSADATAAMYAPGDDLKHSVLLFSATGFVPFPQSVADGALVNDLFTARDVQQIQPGMLGGYVRCGATTYTGKPAAACVWADHGSVGMAVFLNRPVADSATSFRQIREAVLTR